MGEDAKQDIAKQGIQRDQQFGFLRAISPDPADDAENARRWLCECCCGVTRYYRAIDLRRGGRSSCGCRGLENLVGRTFGLWIVQSAASSRNNCQMYLCRCACGGEYHIAGKYLRNGRTQACRVCARKRAGVTNRYELAGQTFGLWTVLARAPMRGKHGTRWWCVCACGEVRDILTQNLLRRRSESCGRCRKSERERRWAAEVLAKQMRAG